MAHAPPSIRGPRADEVSDPVAKPAAPLRNAVLLRYYRLGMADRTPATLT